MIVNERFLVRESFCMGFHWRAHFYVSLGIFWYDGFPTTFTYYECNRVLHSVSSPFTPSSTSDQTEDATLVARDGGIHTPRPRSTTCSLLGTALMVLESSCWRRS